LANRLVGRIEHTCHSICHFPASGPARDKLALGLRVAFEGRYAIYYTHDETELTVVRVIHGARDLNALVNQGAFT
jgi:toxin ParE1/3/4